MSELELLKKQWNKKTQQQSGNFYSEEELQSIYKIKSKRILNSIKRNLWVDAILMVITIGIFIVLLFIMDFNSKLIDSLSLLTIGVLLLLFSRLNFLKLSGISSNVSDVRQMISHLIKQMEFYYRLYIIIVPVLASLLFILYRLKTFYFEHQHYQIDQKFFVSIWPALPLCLIFYFLTRFVFNRLFNQQKKELIQINNYLSNLN